MSEHEPHGYEEEGTAQPPAAKRPINHDLSLIQEVKEALLTGTESAGIDVKVSVEDGSVRLHGVVDVLSHRRAAEEIARRLPGVRHIENDITVANEEASSDKHLLEAVTAKLTSREELRQVGCTVHKGVVSLVGHAGSYGDVAKAVRLVEGMAGVREVRVEQVKVGEGKKEDDADVSRAAERMLAHLGYDPQQFQVYSDAGVLFVKGICPRHEDKSHIKTAMHKIRGVDKLETTLVSEDEIAGEIH